VLSSIALENARGDQEKSAVYGMDLGLAVVDHQTMIENFFAQPFEEGRKRSMNPTFKALS
jgi:hypothetical protein